MIMQSIPQITTSKTLTDIKVNILETLAYFDMFSYPLTKAEVYLFLKNKVSYDRMDDALNCLLNHGIIYRFERFYTMKDDAGLVNKRKEGNKEAATLIKLAGRVGELLIRFPYVRGVAISGSLSKHFADQTSDIDLFIITETNRLWIARTLMHLFKKLTFLFNKEHLFCMNYYVDMQGLEIEEKNIYTAIEVGTLIPLQGDVVFKQFYAANAWIRNFLPNKIMRVDAAKPERTHSGKLALEGFFNNWLGDWLENRLSKITDGRWAKKTIHKKLNNHGVVLAMLSGKHYSKPNPVNFQKSLLTRYQNKVNLVLKQYNDRYSG